jgi:hypothetical protein
MNERPVYLRPEAIPLPWPDLDPVQRHALAKLIAMLKEALDDLAGPPIPARPEWMPWLDYSRKVRLALLTGERGTGKTTVLLSLLRALDKGELTGRDIPGDITQALTALRPRLICLEPLDMAPLPRPTNLLAAILARVEARLTPAGPPGEHTWASPCQAPTDFLPPTDAYHTALAKFTRLQTDVALAWEGNLATRAGSLDPTQYAMEVMRAEHVRLSLNERLTDVLEAVAELLRGTIARDPLFIIPIDDFDLNPLHCLELLDLLRIISVRRLFFILLGDLQLADLVCTIRTAGDMVKLAARPSAITFLPPTTQAEASAHTPNIAGNAIKKLLPPSQRIELAVPDLRTALAFHPHGHVQPILDFLRSCPLPASPDSWKSSRIIKRGIRSLLDVFG